MLRRFFQWLWPPDPTRPAVQEQIVVRLEQAVFNDLRRKLGGSTHCVASSQTTDIQAGYMLGVQHVLTTLQEGYVTARTTAN